MTTNQGETNYNDNHLSDDELLAILAAGQAEHDPPPDSLREVAMRALTWDTGFAQLIAATAVHDPVLVRGGEGGAATADPDVLDVVFEIEGRLLEVAVEPGGVPGTHLVSGLCHPRCDQILLVKPGVAPRPVECDSFGRFEIDGVTGPVALAVELDDGRLIRTELLDLP